MFKLNAGAMHLANHDARAKRITAANDLVNRTLAQHGLLTGQHGGMPDLSGLMGNLATSPPASAPLPTGARFDTDRFACAHGARSYRTYVPSTAVDGINGIVLMLHGCTQTPEDFAIGTGMNALAELHRLVIVYPLQSRGENAQSCWNWFRRGDQMRDRGEPAILAGLVQQKMQEFDIPANHSYVAGLSAGAAMAVILGATYPDVFAAVGAHSGLPFGAATDVPSAFAAMAGQGAEPASPKTAQTVPTIVFHGAADATVHPSNGRRIMDQVSAAGSIQTTETMDVGTLSGRRVAKTTRTTNLGAPMSEHWQIDGLGHAWSGGQKGGSYTDPTGPDASAEMIRFFLETTAGEF